MRLANILLASAVFTCGGVISTTAEGQHTQFSAQSADTAKDASTGAKRLLRTTNGRNDNDAIDEERLNLALLMKLDDEPAVVNKLAKEFAGVNKLDDKTIKAYFMSLRNYMTKEAATRAVNRHVMYLQKSRFP